MKKTDLLYEIKKEIVDLKESPLYQERIRNKVFPVIGEGCHDADIMFVGEAPGAREAATGRPFCGSAGMVLTEILEAIGIERKNVYITNILKDRPPGNRDPFLEEIEVYTPFLDRQIKIIEPNIIVPLGRFAARHILGKYEIRVEPFSISNIHGIIYNASSSYGSIKIVPLKHPATAVYNPNRKKELLEGFESLKKIKGG